MSSLNIVIAVEVCVIVWLVSDIITVKFHQLRMMRLYNAKSRVGEKSKYVWQCTRLSLKTQNSELRKSMN